MSGETKPGSLEVFGGGRLIRQINADGTATVVAEMVAPYRPGVGFMKGERELQEWAHRIVLAVNEFEALVGEFRRLFLSDACAGCKPGSFAGYPASKVEDAHHLPDCRSRDARALLARIEKGSGR